MADNSESEISAVQTKRPRLEQDEHISSSSTSCNVPILNTQYESANLGPSINNSLENCSSTIDDVRPIHEAGSSGDRAGSSLEEASPLCSSSRPRPSSENLSELSSTVPILQDNITTDNEPSSSSATVDVNQHHIDNENDDEDSDDDLDLNLGDWSPQPAKGPFGWLQQQMIMGVNPRSILSRVLPGTNFPSEMEECQLWALLVEYFEYLSEPKRRSKLDAYNTMDDVIRLLQTCTKVLVLTGAGVSVSCGIPDFRSRDGIYARLSQDFPDLPDPQSMFDIHYFRRDPRPFFKFAKEIYPGQFKPSVNHQFISVLEQKGKLLRNYTQNIDTLEQVAGITKVIQCHGSFASASCTRCKRKVNADAIRQDIFNQVVPVCPNCPQDGEDLAVMKPDIVFFGEGLPNTFYESLEDDKTQADLLIVIGSSLKVRPVATIPNMLSHDIPQILINREPLPHMTFDIELLGDSDIIVNELCRRLGVGWNQICHTDDKLEESLDMPLSAKMLFETMPTPPYSQGECEENSQDVNDVSQTEAGADSVFQEAEQTDMASKDQSEKSSEQNVHETDVEKQIKDEVDVSTESSSEELVTNMACETENNLMNKASSSSSFEVNESSVEESPVKTTSGKKKLQRRYSRDSIATHLKPSTFLFLPPNRYIFHGAEVYPDSDSDDSCEQNSSLNTSGSSKDQIKTAEEPTTSATSSQDATEDAPTSVPNINASVMPALPNTASVSDAIKSEMAPLPDAIGDTSMSDVNVIGTDPAVNPSMTLPEVGQHMTNHKEVVCAENPEGTTSGANLQPAHHIEHNPTNHRTELSNSKTTSSQEMSKVCDDIPLEPNQTCL